MGLFRRRPKKFFESGGLPPLPPIGKELGKRLPDLPPLPTIEEYGSSKEFMSEMPETSEESGLSELPPLPETEEKLPELPPLQEIEEEPIPITRPIKKPGLPPLEPLETFEEENAEELPPLPEVGPLLGEETEPFPETKASAKQKVPVRELSELKPLFVKGDDYKSILSGINSIKNKVNEADSLLVTLNEIESDKDKTLKKWRNQLEDIQRGLVYIDKALFGG